MPADVFFCDARGARVKAGVAVDNRAVHGYFVNFIYDVDQLQFVKLPTNARPAQDGRASAERSWASERS